MPAEELRNRLQELHQTLADADQLDPETLASLKQVAGDIERLLEDSANASDEAPAGPVAPDLDLRRDVQSLMLQFETQHPRLTEMLSRIANALANLGI